jgi:hypothetical protein
VAPTSRSLPLPIAKEVDMVAQGVVPPSDFRVSLAFSVSQVELLISATLVSGKRGENVQVVRHESTVGAMGQFLAHRPVIS